jgi:GntR family transcriptional regulator/MocR family aminotransferase
LDSPRAIERRRAIRILAKRSPGRSIPLLARLETRDLGVRESIYKTCLAAIVDGRWPAGTRIASSRQLAAEWRAARNTVDDAFAQLQAEGFLERRVGDGTYVAARLPGQAAPLALRRARRPSALGRRALAAVSAWGRSAQSDYAPQSVPRPSAFLAGLPALDAFPLAQWRRLAARRWRASGTAILGYQPSLGYLPLREATARYLATARGVDCRADQVMIASSSMQAVDVLARVLLERGDVAWIEDPGFPNLRAVLAMAGARIAPVPVDAQGLDVAHGARHAPPASLVYITPSCQYPTGVTLALPRRLALIRHVQTNGAWIVEDDYQSEFTYAGRPTAALASLDRGGRTLYLGTFTNAVFPSLRLAYLVLPPPLVPVFEAVRRQLDDHTHGFMQAVLADFIDGGHFSAHMRRMRALYQARRDALVAACARELPSYATLGPAASGMNVALHLPLRLPDRDVVAEAAGEGLRLLPLSRYAVVARRANGLLLGYTALSERQIGAGIARLARVLIRLGGAGR